MRAALAVVGGEQNAPYSDAKGEPSDKMAAARADRARYKFVNKIVSEVETRRIFTRDKNYQDKIDELLTNKWLGIPIFAAVMFAVFWISQAGPGVWIADAFTGWLEYLQEGLADIVRGVAETLNIWGSILVDEALSSSTV